MQGLFGRNLFESEEEKIAREKESEERRMEIEENDRKLKENVAEQIKELKKKKYVKFALSKKNNSRKTAEHVLSKEKTHFQAYLAILDLIVAMQALANLLDIKEKYYLTPEHK